MSASPDLDPAEPTARGASARIIAAAVRAGRISAEQVVATAIARAAVDPHNAFVDVLRARALARARTVDALMAAGIDPGPLAGTPIAVKNLFDLAGHPTLSGAAFRRSAPPAARDATLVARLEAAGAIVVGTLNMDAFAYGFTTENTAFGPTRNPHDRDHTAGGSSGGSAAAVAAGLAPITLGSDTNGSVRVPAAHCGVWGLKPTFGGLSRAGMLPFVADLDHAGLFARGPEDLALAYDVCRGPDPEDPVCAPHVPEAALPGLDQGAAGLRVAVAGGWFEGPLAPECRAAVARAAALLGARRTVVLPGAEAARAAAFIHTAASGGQLHLEELRVRAAEFEPLSRDRLLAGALVPAAWTLRAQRLRRAFRAEALRALADVDVLIAPATPAPAPRLGVAEIAVEGVRLPARAAMGLYTQPISFIGLPVVAAPVAVAGAALPVGVQLIGRPWTEPALLRAAAALAAADGA